MRLVLGSDHAGFDLKNALVEHLRKAGHEVRDVGTHEKVSNDYPDRARDLCAVITAKEADLGILVCGTGQGMAMTANRQPGIRAGVLSDIFSAKMIRAHNDANVLCLGQRVVGEGLAFEIADAFVATPFEGGRHALRVAKIGA